MTTILPEALEIEKSSSLSRINTGKMSEYEGLRLVLDFMSIDCIDNTLNQKPEFDLFLYASKNIIHVPITEKDILKMLEYVRANKKLAGQKVIFDEEKVKN